MAPKSSRFTDPLEDVETVGAGLSIKAGQSSCAGPFDHDIVACTIGRPFCKDGGVAEIFKDCGFIAADQRLNLIYRLLKGGWAAF